MARPRTLAALTSVAALTLALAVGTIAPAPATTARPAAPAPAVWQPAQDTNWMWEPDQKLNLSNPHLMGTGVTAWNGDTAPGDNPALYDIDGIENPASSVSALHSMSDAVVCYIEVGTAGNYYSAAQEGVPV